MKLLVGLGNPGPRYSQSRHNAGFMTLDLIADKYGLNFESNKRFEAEIAQGSIDGQSCILCKPMTYMNLSGKSILKLLSYYKIKPQEMLVLFDDIDLELGRVKVRVGGGHGGHNGVRSIISSIGYSDFHRIKLGIGRPQANNEQQSFISVADWVLQKMDEKEIQLLSLEMFQTVLDRLQTFLK